MGMVGAATGTNMGATGIGRQWRENIGDYQYLTGNGIDIGYGNDLVVSNAVGWDIEDGDARYMSGAVDESYDFVYSSHCLEHLTNIEEGLTNWCRILKPNGYLFIIIPDWRLYEHCRWPATFNPDHKFTFSLDIKLERKDHYHIPSQIIPLLNRLNVNVIKTRLEDYNFDYNLLESEPDLDQSSRQPTKDGVERNEAMVQIAIIGQKMDLK